MNKLNPEEEIKFLRELYADENSTKILATLADSFTILQVRSQMLLGLVTICLTITGFSGIEIAQSGIYAKICIFIGIISVLITSLLLVIGPLRIQWLSQFKAASIEATLTELIRRRDQRTRLYHKATIYLIIGVSSYVFSLAFFLLNK